MRRGFGLGDLVKSQQASLRLFGVCVSVQSCETTRVSCGCGEHRSPVWLKSAQAMLGCMGERAVRLGAPLALRSLIWSRIRTELERFTCAAMLRMQTLVCAPERCYKLRFSS